MNNEGDYNKKLASSASNFKLFDEVFVKSDAIRSKVEVCDVFAVKEKEFIHVKFRKKSSVSSVLSHLFSQGKISGTLFARDIIFRKNLRAKFKEKGLPVNIIPIEQDKVDCSKYTITFAIIGDPTKTFFQLLPFFSLLNFMLTAQELRVLGFKVKVKKINQA